MSEESNIKKVEGRGIKRLQEVGQAPIFSRFTWVISLIKASGFEWAPIPSWDPDSVSPFLDLTEEVPKKDRECPACDGTGVKDGEPCMECHGHGHFSDDGAVDIRRTVTWAFSAEVEPVVDRQAQELYRLRDQLMAAEAPTRDRQSTLYWLWKSCQLEDRCKPSQRLALIESLISSSLPREARELLRDGLQVYRGLCWKLQAKESHPVYQQPLHRHILVRQGRKRGYLRVDWSPEKQRRKLQEWSML